MEVERRSIDFVPHQERYGKPRRLFTIWFSSNMQIPALMVGTLGIVAGLSLFWTLMALLTGCLIGTIFMAAHSAQGPHLGIPQMIQSRAQFGVLGAAIPLAVVVFAAVFFLAASHILMRDALKSILPVSDNQAIVILGLLTLFIGFIGYELIHRIGAWMTVLSLLIFLGAALLTLGSPNSLQPVQASEPGFSFAAFNLVVAQAASWTLGYGPYVADYSRYLPEKVKTRDTFWSTYLGCALGSLLIMAIGALLAVSIPSLISGNPAEVIAELFGPLQSVVLGVIIVGVVQYNVLCLYSAFMSSATIFSGFRKMTRISQQSKFIAMAALSSMAMLVAVHTQYNFNEYFMDILIGQLYLLVPWSAINLVDYYFIRRGRYHIAGLYDCASEYGRCNLITLAIYAFGILSTSPFMQLSFYEGYFAKMLGADISWIPALVIPGALYYLVFSRQQRLLAVQSKGA